MKNAYELAENILKSKPDKNIELKSSDSFASIELYGTSACKKVQDTEFCECFHLENESGTGMITLYHVFPGIDLVYNDMHMEYCNKEQKPASSVMEINYCMEGRFKMSPTVLKKCFKGVYGDSVYAYMKKYRLQMAERLLKENKLTIGEIALQIGYQNPNKFTSAFRTEYGMSPTEYRKKKTQERGLCILAWLRYFNRL